MEAHLKLDRRVPRVLITRLSHIGDCVLTLPMLNALRRELPQAFIAWAVESPSHQLLGLQSGIDQVIKIPRGWMKSPKEWIRLRRELRSYRFSIAIDPQGITKSSILGRLSGAKLRIGASGRWGRELSSYLNNCLIEPTLSHLVERSLELLQPLNIDFPETPQFDLTVCPTSLSKMQSYVRTQTPQHAFAVINPGASWPSKRWETDRFASVAQQLLERHGMRSIVTWAGDEERAMADQIASSASSAVVVAPATTLRELAALCKLSAFFVGCDTGPLHIAAGVGTPCIGLYGTTRPGESGAYGRQHIAVQKWYQSGTCRERRGADNEAMRDIQVADVVEAIDQMVPRLATLIRKSG